jgi:esterase/lipase
MPQLAFQVFTRLFFTPLHYAVPEKEKKAETFALKFDLNVNDKRISCYRWGEGNQYILLIHGWGGRATQFRRFIKPLIHAGYCVIGFDGPAHGNSSGTKTNIIEFEETIKKIYEQEGVPHAIIAHSFGGGAILFSAMNGLYVPKLITIAMPSIGDEIVNVYLKAINGSTKTGEYFKDYMIKTFHRPFDEFTALHFVKNLHQKIDWLMIHDENDKEVSIDHAMALLQTYPSVKFYKTKELGHTRILKNDDVIRYCVTYLSS